jgi:2-polyprenyl-3-methyl-5-hydroxy-6-metoxy-1,4-benzoquinol methylase
MSECERNVKQQELLSSCPLCAESKIKEIDIIGKLSRCAVCGYIFDNPRPTLSALKGYYSQPSKYEGWIDSCRERDALWKRRLKKILRWKSNGAILDIGTGIGQFLHHAKEYFETACGTEVSQSAIGIAKDKYGINVLDGSIEEVDLGTRMFDIITIFHVLEHVHDPVKVLEICLSHLNEGGFVFIAVPNEIKSVRKRVRGLAKQVAGKLGVERFKRVGNYGLARIALDGTQDEIHLSHFTESVLADLVRKTGFDVVEAGLDPYYVASGIRNLLEKIWFKSLQQIHAVTGANWYETIWFAGKKRVVE